MPKKIFEYRYSAFMGTEATVTVFDSDKENIVISYFPDIVREQITKLELKKSKLEEFKNIINNHQEIFSIGEIENNCICDGIWSEFEVSDGKKTVEIYGGNLWDFDHEGRKKLKEIKKVVSGQEVINAKILLEFFYEVRDFLIKNGVSATYLKY